MGLLEALNHLVNFLLAPIAVGCVAAAIAKLAWRRDLRAVRWRRLAAWSACGATLAAVVSLAIVGRDGSMAAYAAMVVAAAAALMWAGFVRPVR